MVGILLRNLGVSLLRNLLTDKGVIAMSQRRGTIRAGKGTVGTGMDFYWCLILLEILKYKSIIKTNLNLMVFIQEIIYLKKVWGICNKSWWV